MKNRAIVSRFTFALNGVAMAWKNEWSFRVEAACAVALLIFLAIARPPALWCALCAAMAGLVLAAELFNTALESLMDHLHPEIHPAIKIAKDCAAGAVLLVCLSAFLVGAMTVAVVIGSID